MKTITKSSFIFDLKKLIAHTKMKSNLSNLAYYKYNDPKRLLRYLYDHLDKDQLKLTPLIFSGPRFAE
jgi:hypothetical protein